MSELEEFTQLLAAATKRKVEKFDYASLVPGGAWKVRSKQHSDSNRCPKYDRTGSHGGGGSG